MRSTLVSLLFVLLQGVAFADCVQNPDIPVVEHKSNIEELIIKDKIPFLTTKKTVQPILAGVKLTNIDMISAWRHSEYIYSIDYTIDSVRQIAQARIYSGKKYKPEDPNKWKKTRMRKVMLIGHFEWEREINLTHEQIEDLNCLAESIWAFEEIQRLKKERQEVESLRKREEEDKKANELATEDFNRQHAMCLRGLASCKAATVDTQECEEKYGSPVVVDQVNAADIGAFPDTYCSPGCQLFGDSHHEVDGITLYDGSNLIDYTGHGGFSGDGRRLYYFVSSLFN